jgi:Raf kinase inhibitor-like YbhB/YbcL family protein
MRSSLASVGRARADFTTAGLAHRASGRADLAPKRLARSTQPFMSMTKSARITLLAVTLGACAKSAAPTADSAAMKKSANASATVASAAQLPAGSNSMSFRLTSSAFSEGASIPTKYTCEGEDTSPPLAWSGAPQGTRSFAIIVDDPDAPDPAHPKMTYVHWVAYNIPASVTQLSEGAGKGSMPAGTGVGLNDWKKAEFGGPCPPIGTHRYFFKLSALDTTLDLSNPTKPDLESAMKGHVLGTAQLMGTYHKKK